METYTEFLSRINSFEIKEVSFGNGFFMGNPSIAHKVDIDNRFKPFYGDTIVFNLDEVFKQKLSYYVDRLYEEVPECFCERLASNTFHMTLHDLSNSPVLQEVAAEVFENELFIIEKSEAIAKQQKIRMKSKCIFNMVDTSLVMGLYPVNEEEYNKLMKLYCIFDEVRELGYPLTPHITLAYYNVGGFDADLAGRLELIVREMNNDEIEIVLNTEKLYYQKFISMNEYVNVIKLG